MTEWNEVEKAEITEGRCTRVIGVAVRWETCIFLSNVQRKVNKLADDADVYLSDNLEHAARALL